MLHVGWRAFIFFVLNISVISNKQTVILYEAIKQPSAVSDRAIFLALPGSLLPCLAWVCFAAAAPGRDQTGPCARCSPSPEPQQTRFYWILMSLCCS